MVAKASYAGHMSKPGIEDRKKPEQVVMGFEERFAIRWRHENSYAAPTA